MSRRVLVFVSSLRAGGLERAAVRLTGWLRDRGHSVSLVTLSSVDADFYGCPAGVERLGLHLAGRSSSIFAAGIANFRRALSIRKVASIRNVEVAISLGDRSNVLMLVALYGLPCRKIISERSDPERQKLGRGWSFLRRIFYPSATLHVSQSSYVDTWIRTNFPSIRSVIIGNAVSEEFSAANHAERSLRSESDAIHFVCVGRLEFVKGGDLLIEAFAMARKKAKARIELTLVGDGSERQSLRELADRLGVADIVKFAGQRTDVAAFLKAADVFVLPSRLEGFPNTVVEAMAVGLPVIAARCQGGVEDILGREPERFALEFLPGDVAGLAKCIVRMADAPSIRARLGKSSRQRAACYEAGRIASAWFDVVEK